MDQKVAFAGLAIVVAQLSTNLGAALGKSLFPLVGPEGVAALRTGISALILLAISRPWRIALTKRQITFLALYGLALGSMNLLIYLAIERLPIGVAIAIEISGPLSVVLLTSRSIRDFFWFALAVASLLMLMPWPGSQARLDPFGIAFAFGAAGCWALYILFGKRASELGSKTAVALGMSIACAVTLPFGVVMAGEKLLVSPVLWLGLVVALLSSAIPYILEMKALERLSSRMFGVIISSAPAIGALAGYLILGEQLTLVQWLAVATMISASAGCTLTAAPAVTRPIEKALI
ncbi:inner membrane transporter RhtA [Nitrosospira multiformis]|uniref:Inner membrane transporter RhtA n=2 Tax=Nitrosospira multiformis TaxID=1231 RepID=A0A1I0BKC1_9PROT|nr:inner membrane transporter RhtA [Nitrosospira multiformis]